MNRECGCCGEENRLLFIVLHKDSFRGLCTACILLNHREYFCPICFDVFESGEQRRRLICVHCTTIAHLSCTDSRPFICPFCADPNFSFEGARRVRCIRKESAKLVLAAAKISVVTMKAAAKTARTKAEAKGKEAILAHRMAKESLEKVLPPLDCSDDGDGDGDEEEEEDDGHHI